jgi:hypothetical protein
MLMERFPHDFYAENKPLSDDLVNHVPLGFLVFFF